MKAAHSRVLADDALVAILHFLPKKKGRFNADRKVIHETFAELSKEFPGPLGGIEFRQQYLFPDSPELDQALSVLEASHMLTRVNNTPRFYFVQEAVHDAFRLYVKKDLKTANVSPQVYREIAKKFAERLCS